MSYRSFSDTTTAQTLFTKLCATIGNNFIRDNFQEVLKCTKKNKTEAFFLVTNYRYGERIKYWVICYNVYNVVGNDHVSLGFLSATNKEPK